MIKIILSKRILLYVKSIVVRILLGILVMETILVTWSSWFIGSNLSKKLLDVLWWESKTSIED